MALVSPVVLDSALRRLLGSSNRLTKQAAIAAVVTLAEAVEGENVIDIMDVMASAAAVFVLRAAAALGRADTDPVIDEVAGAIRRAVAFRRGAAVEAGHAD